MRPISAFCLAMATFGWTSGSFATTDGSHISTIISNPASLVSKIKLKIMHDAKFTAVGSSSFIATKNSSFCKEWRWNEGSVIHAPKTIWNEFEENSDEVLIPSELSSKCNYVRTASGASLAFQIKGKAEPYNVVSIFQGQGTQQPQVVTCLEIYSGPSGKTPMISCDGDIELDPNGHAVVLVK